MKSPNLLARSGLLAAAALAVTAVSFTPAGAQINPSRLGAGTNDAEGLETTENTLRAAKARAEFLGNEHQQAENWHAATRFASCAANLNEDRVRQLLDQSVEGKAKRLEFSDFLNRNRGCVSSSGLVDRDFLRGAMAELLIVGGDGELPPPGDAQSVMTFLRTVKVPSTNRNDPFVAGQLLAECRVGFAPVAARALIATEPGSAEEAGALTAMKAVTPQCDSLDSSETKLTPLFERAFAAQALYHWAEYSGG